ncbi:MAG: DUF3540 domain-containing protein [Deltaproteobacteria bacterium]|jgi:hypothetical protein|nr:DUF3540 domain-containing protein [Deltaproteobacteria bacterium]
MNLARHETYFSSLATAEVLAVNDDVYSLTALGLTFLAKKAFSALIDPAPGDKVTYWLDNDETYYILAILDRPKAVANEAEPMTTLTLPNQTTVKGQALSLKAAALALETTVLNGQAGRAFFSGAYLKLNFSLCQVLAKKAISVLGGFFQRCQTARLEAESTDLIATRVKITAAKTLAATAESLDLRAKSAVKIDGRVIELG